MNKSARDENGLNKRERTILKFIQKEIDLKGYPPSVREICKAVKLKSTATVQGYLNSLEERGYLKKENQKGRTLRLIKNHKGEEVVTGNKVTVSGGTLTTDEIGQGNLRCYVLQTSGAPSGKIGEDGTYLK